MSDKYNLGNSVSGDAVYFCFGWVPASPRYKSKRYTGAFKRHGEAYEHFPVSIQWSGKPTDPDKIICEEATFSYSKKTNLRAKHSTKCGAHTCFDGLIRGNVGVTISKPIMSVRNRESEADTKWKKAPDRKKGKKHKRRN